MKKILLIGLVSLVSLGSIAQGKSDDKKPNHAGKKHKIHESRSNHEGDWSDDDNQGRKDGRDKYSKNVPTKVMEAFQRDHPNAVNTVWTKSKGNWTATYGNGIYRSTATYHANGKRRAGDAGHPYPKQSQPPAAPTPTFPW